MGVSSLCQIKQEQQTIRKILTVNATLCKYKSCGAKEPRDAKLLH